MEKFSTLPHQLENAVRFPHFPQHYKDIWTELLIFIDHSGLRRVCSFEGRKQNGNGIFVKTINRREGLIGTMGSSVVHEIKYQI